MSLFPRHQNFWYSYSYKWIPILDLILFTILCHYASQLLGQDFMKSCIKLYRSHPKPLNQLPLWHLLTCNTILKAAGCGGNPVVLVFSSHADVVCSSLLCSPLRLVVCYIYIFHWLKPHLFGSYSLVLFSLHPCPSPAPLFSVSEYAKKWIFMFPPQLKWIIYRKLSL